jgi:chloride channel 3/4/5
MFGYIAAKELEHGLATVQTESLETPITFRAVEASKNGMPFSAVRLFTPVAESTHDFSWLVEMAPLTVNIRSPMELLHEVRSSFVVVSQGKLIRRVSSQLFSKLGARYLVMVDERGYYRGIIEKNRFVFWPYRPCSRRQDLTSVAQVSQIPRLDRKGVAYCYGYQLRRHSCICIARFSTSHSCS